jgi:hypothetical protein
MPDGRWLDIQEADCYFWDGEDLAHKLLLELCDRLKYPPRERPHQPGVNPFAAYAAQKEREFKQA